MEGGSKAAGTPAKRSVSSGERKEGEEVKESASVQLNQRERAPALITVDEISS